MSFPIHAACIAAVGIDLLGRTYRLRWFARSTGATLSVRDAFVTTSFGDAAAALTPWRAAGEPARVFGMTHGGATVSQSIVTLTAESILNYLVVIAVAAPLLGAYGGDYWAALPSLGSMARTVMIVGGGVSAAVALGWLVMGHHASALAKRIVSALQRAVTTLRDSAGMVLTLGLFVSAVSLAARLAILPLLALGIAGRPSIGVLTVASFTLLYAQLVVPSPSGAGVVDGAVLAGGAAVDDGAGALLAAWRFYTTILPTIVGLAAAVWAFGPTALSVFRRKP